jgi:hypothetical protein
MEEYYHLANSPSVKINQGLPLKVYLDWIKDEKFKDCFVRLFKRVLNAKVDVDKIDDKIPDYAKACELLGRSMIRMELINKLQRNIDDWEDRLISRKITEIVAFKEMCKEQLRLSTELALGIIYEQEKNKVPSS